MFFLLLMPIVVLFVLRCDSISLMKKMKNDLVREYQACIKVKESALQEENGVFSLYEKEKNVKKCVKRLNDLDKVLREVNDRDIDAQSHAYVFAIVAEAAMEFMIKAFMTDGNSIWLLYFLMCLVIAVIFIGMWSGYNKRLEELSKIYEEKQHAGT